jgi:hypothetical protein
VNANRAIEFHNGIRFQDKLLILFQRASDFLYSFGVHGLVLIVVECDLCIWLQMFLLEVKLILIFDSLNIPYRLFNPIVVRNIDLNIRFHFHSCSFDFLISGNHYA